MANNVQIMLHQHPPVHKLYRKLDKPPPSYALAKDAPDNPWLLFHPDAFNLAVAPWRRFSDERAESSRMKTTRLNNYYQEPYEMGVLEAECVTALKLDDKAYATAIKHIRDSGSLNRARTTMWTHRNLIITADDLWRD